MSSTLYIGIDCAPGALRPDAFIENAIKVFDLTAAPEPSSKFFGAWTWHIPCDLTEEGYREKENKLRAYMDDLCTKGLIRGAMWDFFPYTEND